MISKSISAGTTVWILTRRPSLDLDRIICRVTLSVAGDTVITTSGDCVPMDISDELSDMVTETILSQYTQVAAYPICDCYVTEEEARKALLKGENSKYVFTGEQKVLDNGVVLKRIRSISSFGGAEDGDFGGWIECEANLSCHGRAWVADEATVYGDAVVCGNAFVGDSACICGNAMITDDAEITDDASVFGNAVVLDNAVLYGAAVVGEHATVCKDAVISEHAVVIGNALVTDSAHIHGHARIFGKVVVDGSADVKGHRDLS